MLSESQRETLQAEIGCPAVEFMHLMVFITKIKTELREMLMLVSSKERQARSEKKSKLPKIFHLVISNSNRRKPLRAQLYGNVEW